MLLFVDGSNFYLTVNDAHTFYKPGEFSHHTITVRLCRWTWRSGGWWTRGRDVCGRSLEVFITLRRQRRVERASTRCFRFIHPHTRSPTVFINRTSLENLLCVRPRRLSSHPSLTCARTAGSARCRRSASASPKSRPTPSDASATAKTPGTCWVSSLVPRGV